MRRFEKSIIINRPIGTVFAYLSHFENESKWMPGVLQTTQISEGSVGVGTRYLEVSSVLPLVRAKEVYEITEYESNKKIAFKSVSGPFNFTGSCRVEPLDTGTKFTYLLDLHIRGLSLLEPIASRIFASKAETGFDRLKSLLESSA